MKNGQSSIKKNLHAVGFILLTAACLKSEWAHGFQTPISTGNRRSTLVRSTLRGEGTVDVRTPVETESSDRKEGSSGLPYMDAEADLQVVGDKQKGLLESLTEKMGVVEDHRFEFPELSNGEVPRMFSSLKYVESEEGRVVAAHDTGSTFGAAALVAGTTIGAGVLALPTATVSAGFLPSTLAMGIAWVYMTMSGLLIAELTINRLGTTGRPGVGLLDIYRSSLGPTLGNVGSTAYYFLHYAVMVAYIAQGGSYVGDFLTSVAGLESIPGAGQATFAAICGVALYAAKPSSIEKANNVLVAAVLAAFVGIMGIGAGTADFASLVDLSKQHPEAVASCFPILFLSLVYQNVVPTVVTQLEGNRAKITNALIAGTAFPFLLFVAWNAIVLGNVAGMDLNGMDPVALLQSGSGSNGDLLGPLVGGFSVLAVTTSLIGFTYGLLDALTDSFGLSSKGSEYEQWKAPLFGLVFLPPLLFAILDPDVFYNALDYAGAFGVSTLFLVLPPLMVWRQRYGDEQTPLMTKPMVPFGKIPLGSMWKAAGTLILEQGAEKLGIIDFFVELFHGRDVIG